MNWKQGLLLGLTSTTLSTIAGSLYSQVYSKAFYVDFSSVLNWQGIIIACLIGCTLMSATYFLLLKWEKEKFLGWANILFAIVSFASIISVLSFKLPLEMEMPELFPGLAIPMHFFPALSFLSIYPFFKNKYNN
jgi:hypothetical protein